MTPTLVASHANGDTLPLSQEVGANFPKGGPSENGMLDELLGERELSKLRWRCRRGLLENDLLIEKFFAQYESTLTTAQAKGMNDLMDLSDNDLLDLLLQRKEPADLAEADAKASASTFEALQVLNLLRPNGKTLPVPV
jgi:antitoxin CptB